MAKRIERKAIIDTFSFNIKYPKIARNIVCVLIINTTFATVVSVMLITKAMKLRDKKRPPIIAGKPESLMILKVFFL
tara:strand:- start:118 stop:348 length:231 start_codon:yes stop_codon:yes gene_type:complete